MPSKPTTLFQEYFTVKDIDKDGKAFDKVSRLHCEGDDVKLTLDINMDIYPARLNDEFRVTIASTLSPGDTSVEVGEFNPRLEESSLFQENEYIMFGRVFKTKPEVPNVSIYASFGGLLMQLFGDPGNLKDIVALDSNANIYLLMHKTKDY
eukprot:CAMPEP_0206193654 /NCGR_PEP_ID=MMETSP0166-20121206/6699_1 /ASSEMBLY_ACC=CAM_ASM_000260 /TAXON_ID=95228 /ORGANISM="Vannella robusta, Strain DIVA3 518/3/11/1/6" /LENGTH=150 /DNA_ID=CAMNT_0053610415 /DNA_START=1 /DNA_END=453 /DNA_ORIENTATION=-